MNFAAQGLGRAATFAPDFTTASQKIKKTLATIHREPRMDVNQGDFPSDPPKGEFVFKNVCFRYPTRRKNRILKVSVVLMIGYLSEYNGFWCTNPSIYPLCNTSPL